MSNAITALNPTHWKDDVQDYLNNLLVTKDISNFKEEKYLTDGDTVDFPSMPTLRVQSYTPGTDLTIDDISASDDELEINIAEAATFRVDRIEEKKARTKYDVTLARQAAYELQNRIDQTGFARMSTAATNPIAGGSVTISTVFSLLSEAKARLVRNNAADAELFAVFPAEIMSLLEQNFVANGFNMADAVLKNGKVGQASGFQMYVSNNLPTSQTVTFETQATAGKTVSLFGVTFNIVANGGATAAGDVSIGANLAAFQANLRAAVNGTGTPGASTYIELELEDRRVLQSAQASMAAFSSDDAVVTGYGRIAGETNDTGLNNGWGTETSQIMTGRKGALSMALQIAPEVVIAQEPRQPAKNVLTFDSYGMKVFRRDARRLKKITVNL